MTIIKQFLPASIGVLAIASILFHPGISLQAPATESSRTTTPTTRNFLVSIREAGGMCVGGCFSELTIFADGTYRYGASGLNQQKTGKINQIEFQRLQQLIATANFKTIKSVPFRGTCPIAYDGTETIYTFRQGNRTEVVRSCQTQIDSKSSLFQQLERIYRQGKR